MYFSVNTSYKNSMKKKFLSLLLVAGMIGTMLAPTTVSAALEDYNIVTNAEDNKVIFDTDMGYFGDDTYALFMLTQADAAGYIDLLGVTSVGANVTIAEGTTAILNQLEAVGREDIPVYMGTDVPIMGLHDDATIETNGLKRIKSMEKVLTYGDSISYDNLGELENETWGYSNLKPQEDKTAWEFMVDAVKENPGKVTIIAVGACTNVALAIKSDPTFAANTAGIYYMGGAIDVPGNDTPCAERNWYYDPESVEICLQADFPVQVVVPHDISYNQKLTKELVEKLMDGDTAYNKLVEEYAYPRFEEDPERQQSLWDAQVPGIFLCPDLISSTDVRDIAMETNMGYTYGESVAWEEGTGPATSTTCTVVYDVDGEAYWSFVADLYSTQF